MAKVGLIGCGNISGIYLQNSRRFRGADIVACADLDLERARAKASEAGIRAASVDELLSDPSIDAVLNLTIPKAHAPVSISALNAGKHVYSEKPLATSLNDVHRILSVARDRNVRVGCAPDTFLGGGLQTCRKLIDDGVIGEPVGATAFMISRGHESWHPDPAFYYEVGAGPMMDMGPYYLTALVHLLGPIRRVTGSARITFPERIITSQPKHGEKVRVEVPTHVAGVMDFESGAVGTILTTFDVWFSTLPRIEVYGSDGSLLVPDPNTFGGPVMLRKPGDSSWEEVPLTHGYTENSRGIGLADMAQAIESGRPHRASGDLALHVLEAMEGIHTASESGRHYEMTTEIQRPEPLIAGESTLGQ